MGRAETRTPPVDAVQGQNGDSGREGPGAAAMGGPVGLMEAEPQEAAVQGRGPVVAVPRQQQGGAQGQDLREVRFHPGKLAPSADAGEIQVDGDQVRAAFQGDAQGHPPLQGVI